MTEEKKLQVIKKIKKDIFEKYNLNTMDDDGLDELIVRLTMEAIHDEYMTIAERADIRKSVFNSIRGLGPLDSIIEDEKITEIMINGPKNIFVEKAGELSKIEQTFEDEEQLENIIQKIVGQAGREVNQ